MIENKLLVDETSSIYLNVVLVSTHRNIFSSLLEAFACIQRNTEERFKNKIQLMKTYSKW